MPTAASMDVVVYLALAVLGAVFLFSLLILIVMCRRRYDYGRFLEAQSLRFSKLQSQNCDDVVELGPHISHALDNNLWVYEVTGVLQHCVAVLKLCHHLTDQLAKIPLNQINPQLNEIICQATSQVTPRFDALLRSLAGESIDIRLTEARVSALVSACWSLLVPFYLINPKFKEVFGGVLKEMQAHQQVLQLAVEQAEERGHYNVAPSPSAPNPSGAAPKPAEPTSNANSTVVQTVLAEAPTTSTAPAPTVQTTKKPEVNGVATTKTTLTTLKRPPDDDERTDLLNDEAPADPSIS